jgi:hypothetical protein
MEAREKLERENKTIFVMLRLPKAFSCLSEYLTFKEYHRVASLCKTYNEVLRN